MTPGLVEGIAIDGNTAYVVNGTFGLSVIDVSNPAAPRQTGSFNTPGYAYSVAVSDDYCYNRRR